jgi:hypothetical protein
MDTVRSALTISSLILFSLQGGCATSKHPDEIALEWKEKVAAATALTGEPEKKCRTSFSGRALSTRGAPFSRE